MVMMDEYMTKKMIELFTNPLFKIGFFEFFLKMQQEGIEAARKFWSYYAEKNNLFPNAADIYERILDLYIILGFIPSARYDQVLNRNKILEEENRFLRDTIRQLQLNLFTEGGEKVQSLWHNIIDKQLEINNGLSKNFYDLFRLLKVGSN
jgi:hypothetical protein